MVYQHGEWVPVYVDDRMPILRSGRPAFATSKKGDAELWPMLIEKAWVKSWAQGDYAAVEGGRPAHALRAFTGAPCEEVRERHSRHATLSVFYVFLRFCFCLLFFSFCGQP